MVDVGGFDFDIRLKLIKLQAQGADVEAPR